MSIEPVLTFPPQPNTERARRTGLAGDKINNLFAYPSGKLVIVRSAADPLKAHAVYRGHRAAVTSVAFSSRGDVCSGDVSGQVHIWTVSNPSTAKYTHQILAGQINALSWCKDGERIIAVGAGKSRLACAFMADSGNAIGEIAGHGDEINGVAMRPARPLRAATVGENGLVVFHEGPPFKFSHSKQIHQNAVTDVQYSPNAAVFVTSGWDRKLAVYDGLSGEFQAFLDTQHEGMILALSFLTDDLVLTVSTDSSVRISSIAERKLKNVYTLPRSLENQILGVAACSEQQFVTVTLNGDLQLWTYSASDSADSDKEVKPTTVEQGHQGSITALGMHAGNLYSAATDGSVVEWTKTGVRVGKHEGPVCSLIGDLASVGWDRKIQTTQNLDKPELLKSTEQPVAADESQNTVIVVSEHFVEVVNGRKAELYGSGSSVSAVDELVAVGHGTTASVYTLPNLELKHTFPARQAAVSAVSVSPDKQYLAVGDVSGKIGLYTLSDFQLKTSRWAFHTSKVTSIKWTEDSLHVVSGALDTNVYIYSVERPGKNIKLLNAHKDGVHAVQWAGKDSIYTGGADGTVCGWSVKW